MANAITRLLARGGYALANAFDRPVETRAGGDLDGFGWSIVSGQEPTVFQGTGREVRTLGFEKHPIVQACTRVISDIVATVDFQVYKKGVDDEVTLLPQSPAQQLLHSPRVGMNRVQLRKLTTVHMLVYGNAFWVLERERPNGPPTSIRLVHPENIRYGYLDSATLEFVKYSWQDRMGSVHTTLAQDMVHFRDLTASDWLFGFPRAAAALIDISADYEAGQFVRQMVKNNGAPALAVMVDGSPTLTELQTAEERFREKQVARGQRGGVAFMSGVKDVKTIAFNFKDLEFSSLRAIAREDICAVFGVDPRMIGSASAKGTESGLSGAQYGEARRRLIAQTVLPIMGDIEATLDDWFAPEWGYVYVRFNPDELAKLTEDKSETSTRTLAELFGGLITREEGRARIDMPEDMDLTDTLVGSATRVEYPVAEQFEKDPPPAPPPGTPGTPAAPPAPGASGTPTPDASTNEKPPTEPKTPAGGTKSRPPGTRVLKRGTTLSADQRRELWSHFDTRATAQEGPYRRAAAVLFHTEKTAVHRTFDAAAEKGGRSRAIARNGDDADPYVTAALRAITADYAPGGDYHQAWLDRYQALIATTVNSSGGEVATSLGVDFNLDNPKVQAAIADRATRLATLVGETTAEKITAAVSAGRAAGMGISDIADLVDETVFGGTTAARATMIARTESVGAMNQGEFLAAQESGVVQSKEWLTQGDDRVRDSHAEQDGEVVDMGDTFTNGCRFPGDPDGLPEETINCRCTLLFHDDDSSDES